MRETEKFPGLGDRIRLRLRTLGYWKRGRPDVARFCRERGYRPQYVYAWLTDRVPGYPNLRRLARDLQVSEAWILFGTDRGRGPAGVGAPAAGGLAGAATRAEPPPGDAPEAAQSPTLVDLPRLRELIDQLRQFQAELDGIFRAFPDLYYWVDREGRIVSYRAGRGSQPDLAPAAFLGRPLREILAPGVGRRLHEAFLEALHTDQVVAVEYEVLFADGLHSREARFLSLGRGGEPAAPVVLAVVRDITERVRGEAVTRALVEVGLELAGTLDLPDVTRRVASAVLRLFRARRSVLYEFDPASGALTCVAVAGEDDPGWWLGRVLPPGMGLAGRAVDEAKPLSTRDALSDPRLTLPDWLTGAVDERFRAGVAAPLVARGRTVGALVLSDAIGRAFSEEEIGLLSAFASTAALALANARLYSETERRRASAEGLAAVGRILSQSLDPDEVSRRIAESVCQLLSVSAAAVWRIEPQTGDLATVAVAGETAPIPAGGLRRPRGTGLAGLAVQEGRTVITPDLLADPRIVLSPEMRAHAEQGGIRAAVATPLVVHGEAIGVLSVAQREPREFSREEIELLEAFAVQATTAFQNSRLFAAAEHRRQVAERLAEIGRSLAQASDPEEVPRRIVLAVMSLLGVGGALLWQVDRDTGELRALAQRGDFGPIRGPLRYRAGEGLSGLAVREAQVVVTDDILVDPRITLTPAARSRILATPLRAGMGVPLIARGKPIGALTLADRLGRRYGAEEIEIARAFADQAAVALEGSQLSEGPRRLRDGTGRPAGPDAAGGAAHP